MANTIDELMDKDPLELSAVDIDEIIAYERKQRGLHESGVKPKRAEGEKKTLDIGALLTGLGAKTEEEAPKPKVARRM